MDELINKICRLCLAQGVHSPIFAGITPLDKMIEKCTNIKISRNDGLPTQICSNCIYKLGVAYHLKKQAENSDIKLKHYLGIPTYEGYKDMMTMTESSFTEPPRQNVITVYKCVKCRPTEVRKSSSRKRSKPECEQMKRGPKPKNKPPETCDQCGKDFKCKAQLDMHVRTHTGEKPFVCKVCRKGFAQKYNLEIHIRLHSNEKPYQCEVCSKTFTAQGNLQTHLKIHNNQRDQICQVCKKAFITSSDLTRHMMRHTGIKRHRCNLCNSAYTQIRDLKMHKWKKHNINDPTIEKKIRRMQQHLIQTTQQEVLRHKCTFCEQSFEYLSVLARHCEEKHSQLFAAN